MLVVGLVVSLLAWATETDKPVEADGGVSKVHAEGFAKQEGPRDVDLVICLDTSGSMSGLIESAKRKLWAIVNELATARPRPRLRVALYHYGNSGLSKENGWVERLCPLTDDLDKVYENIFKLRTNGGTEYVARVVRAATMELKWSGQKNALKMIVVAGNEPATQDGSYKLQDVCKEAIGKGIIINTIFCGDEAKGRRTGWADAAQWADGQFAAIDQNTPAVVIRTPYDKKLGELNEKLNKTYIAYGRAGAGGLARQKEQDKNAAGVSSSVSAERVAAKASGLYRNAGWDLVDAVETGKVKLEELKTADLPKDMQNLSADRREAHVTETAKRRKVLRKDITELSVKRLAYQKKEAERQGLDESGAFDANLLRAIRSQGQKKGMTFQKK